MKTKRGLVWAMKVGQGLKHIAASLIFLVSVATAPAGAPPGIVTPPEPQTVAIGSTVTFTVTANGDAPLYYRWRTNSITIPGSGANAFVTFSNVQASVQVSVVISNAFGAVTSAPVNLTVALSAPVFALQPSNQTVYYGRSASFNASAIGAPVTLRWYHDDVWLTANSSDSLFIASATAANAGSYFCVATNPSGMATSQIATLTVLSVPPVISGISPYYVSVPEGSTASFNFNLENPPASFQLLRQFSGISVPARFTQIAFSSVPTFKVSLDNINPSQAGYYELVASNAFGWSTNYNIWLAATSSAPQFRLSPTNQTVFEGTTALLSFNVDAAPSAQASLYRNGLAMGLSDGISVNQFGQVVRIFTLVNVTLADAGDYFVVASNRYGMATSYVAQITVQRAGPLDKWTIRNPLPQGRDLHSIVWAQNQFVAVGDNGAIVTSSDGTNWIARNAHTASWIQAVTYGGGRFVAVTRSGTGLISTNGENWDSTLIQSNVVFWDATFGNGSFLAVGEISSPYTLLAFRSTDGMDWSPVTIPYVTNASAIAATFGAGRFLVLDYSGAAYSSTDLSSWTVVPGIVPHVPYSAGLGYFNGRFAVVTSSGYVNSSVDGLTWGTAVYNGVTGKSLNGVAYGAGRYVAVAGKGNIITSGNLQSWTAVASPTADRLEGVTFANNLFVAVGENGTILTSSDGLSWSNQTRGVSYDLDGLAIGNGLAVAVGKSGVILTSTNGTTWNYAFVPGGPAELHGVAYGGGKWVAVGNTTNIFTSTNALYWEAQSPTRHTPTNDIAAFAYLKSVLYASNLWVAVGEGGQIITSPDALTWTVRASGVGHDLNEVAYGNGQWVIVGDDNIQPNATVLASADGFNWVNHSYYSASKNARAITFADGLFVMALNDGLILYSTNVLFTTNYPNLFDGWHWAETGINANGNNLRGVTRSNGLWVAVGNDGIILTSSDAQTWRRRVSPTYENLHDVRYINNTFIAIGNDGVILQSTPLTSELLAENSAGNFRLIFSSPYEGVFKVQQTEDFIWEDLALITNVFGTVEYIPVRPEISAKRFYRVVAP